MVPTSRKGRSNGKNTHIGVRIGSDVVELLRSAATGRNANEPLLERWRHKRQGSRWVRDRRGPWTDPARLNPPWEKIIKRAGLPDSDSALFATA